MHLISALLLTLTLAASQQHWVAAWGASPSPQLADEQQMRAAKLTFENQTLREIVHVSIAGKSARIRLSNAFGKDALDLAAVHIALRAKDSSIVPGTDHAVSFSNRPSVSIPPDALALSDPIEIEFPAAADLAISIFIAKSATAAGIHYAAQQTSYIGSGDLTAAPSFTDPATTASWIFLSGVDVLAPEKTSAIAAFGDSITDGAHSTNDTNHRWPDFLAARLHGRFGMLDAGIGGNRILHDASGNIRFGVNALARFDRDVLAQAGIRYVIVLEGINDLGHAGTSAPESETVSAEDLIAGLKQLIERAHEKGIRIVGATLTPFEGASRGYFTPEKELKRKAVNEWIRSSRAFDGVIDFDKAVRDPEHPDRMSASYDSGDHLHPSDAGYRAMAGAIDLSLFKK